jgi:hypothetical protein
MKFVIAYQRALMGNDIDVQVDAEAEEVISAVVCILDDFEVSSDDFSAAPLVSFHRTLNNAGQTGPGQTHKLIVKVQGIGGDAAKYASRIWTDIS